MQRIGYFLLLPLALLALTLAGCDSGEDDADGGGDGGGDAGGAIDYDGIQIVNTGDVDLVIITMTNFCEPGLAEETCRTTSGGSFTTIIPGDFDRNLRPADEFDRLYVEWTVEQGEGRIEVVRGTGIDSDFGVEGFEVDEVLETFDVTAGDEGSDLFPF